MSGVEKWIEHVRNCGWEIDSFGKREITTISKRLDGYDRYIEDNNTEIEFKIDEGGEYESIIIQKARTLCGDPVYMVSITTYNDLNDEIICCESCHDCFKDCLLYNLSEEEREKRINEQFEEWTKGYPIVKRISWKYIIVNHKIISRKCYVNIPHRHYYRAEEITIFPLIWDELLAFLGLRYFILSLI